MKAINIKWDIDCYDCGLWEQGKDDGTCIHYINNDCPYGYHDEDLPTEIEIPNGMTDEEEISDYITDKTGFCHYGFELVD